MFVRRRRGAGFGFEEAEEAASWSADAQAPPSSERSDSGTVSSDGSFLCEHVHRPPWLQQQLSGTGVQKISGQTLGRFLFYFQTCITVLGR